MFGFKKLTFHPNFPIIELDYSISEARNSLKTIGKVIEDHAADEDGVNDHDYELFAENSETRINIGFKSGKILYVSYLTDNYNHNRKSKIAKFKWFIEHYGGKAMFSKPQNTGHLMISYKNDDKLSIVLGLHMGPIRINNHINDAQK